MKSTKDLVRVRWAVAMVIMGLLVSGATAFPLLEELNWLSRMLVGGKMSLNPSNHTGFTHWILKVREGLEVTYKAYPFVGYGTDWLGFGHVVIALFFLPVWKNPVRYIANLRVGIAACILVWPVAMVAGSVREIPISWRLIDCSFGFVALFPLYFALRITKKMESQDPGHGQSSSSA